MNLQATLPDGSTIVLRPPTEADIPAIFEGALASHAELTPWMPWCDEDFNIGVAEKWVKDTNASDEERSFTVWDETGQTFLGNCGLHTLDTKLRSAEMGYWIRTDRAGHGIGHAAAKAVAEYAFNDLDLVRVEIVIAVGNEASKRVMEKLNAKCEGVQRNRMIHHEEIRDAWMYSLIPEDLTEE